MKLSEPAAKLYKMASWVIHRRKPILQIMLETRRVQLEDNKQVEFENIYFSGGNGPQIYYNLKSKGYV